MAKWLITALIVICMTSAYAATLIDSEDFESYTSVPLGYNQNFNRTLFFDEAARWHCELATYPHCLTIVGGASFATGQTANWTLYNQYGNNYLSLWALGGYNGDYFRTLLQYYLTNTTAVANQNYTIKYDFILNGMSSYSPLIAADKQAMYSGVLISNLNLYNAMPMSTVVGGNSVVTSAEEFMLLRIYQNSTQMNPSASTCNISDSAWHTITQHIYTDAGCKLNGINTYIDGVLCDSRSLPSFGGWACGANTAINPKIGARGVFAISIDNIEFYTGEAEASAFNFSAVNNTICDSFTLPYYLKESFNGRLYQCNWSASNSDFYYGELFVQNNTFFYAQKDFASPVDGTLLSKDTSRYATISYDLSLLGANSGENWELRLYDDSNRNVFTIYSDANSYYYVSNAAGVWLGNLSTSTYNWKIVIDLTMSKADIYLNNVLLEDDATMAVGFYNVMNLKRIKVASANVEFTMDNLQIYSSDSTGLPQLPDVTIAPGFTGNDTVMCGLMYRNASACNEDSDCVTGKCSATGVCSQFDWTYCDRKGKYRGNYCFFSGVASCAGTNVSKVIFDNFLWVLVAIVLLMGIVYLSIMVRRK
jgi:hypothetical protein